MKKFYFLILLLNIQLFAQPDYYNFGTAPGTTTFNTPNLGSGVFLPTAPSAGGARVYIGNAGGQFSLVNPGIAGFGTDTELQGIGSSGSINGAINKFSIYEISSASTLFSLRFSFRLDGGEDGSEWDLLIGKNGGFFSSTFEKNSFNSSTSQILFVALKFVFSATSAINSSVNLNGSFWQTPVSWGINKATNHYLEVFANNSNSTTVDYTYGTSQNVGPYSYDIWLDGNIVIDDQSRSGLPADLILDSFCFIGRNSSGNNAAIYLDDIYYSNTILDGPLPVELSSFTSSIIGNTVNLKWETATEVNNYGFEVERKVGNGQSSVGNFEKIGFVNGNGNSNSPKYYSYEDKDLSNSKYSYRLKQIDNDGQFEYSNAIEVDLGNAKEYSLLQNFPNPFNPSTKIEFKLPEKQMVSLRVYNMLGEMVKNLLNEEREAGTYSVTFDGSGLSSGIYIYRLETANYVANRKMSILK